MPRRERRLSAALEAAARRRERALAAAARPPPRPPRASVGAQLESARGSRSDARGVVIALAHHRVPFRDLLELRRCFDDVRAVVSPATLPDDGLLHPEALERVLFPSTRQVSTDAHRPPRRVSRPAVFARAPSRRRPMSFADVLAVMYPLSTPRERVAMADATAPRETTTASEDAPISAADAVELFRRADEDASGELDASEFGEVLRELGVDDAEEREAMFREMDADGGGTVSWEEFREWWFGEGEGEDE